MYISSRLCCLVRCLTGTIPFPAQCFITLMTCYLSRSMASCHGMSKPDSESLCFPNLLSKNVNAVLQLWHWFWVLFVCIKKTETVKGFSLWLFLMHALKIMAMPIWLQLRPMLQHRRWIKNYCLDTPTLSSLPYHQYLSSQTHSFHPLPLMKDMREWWKNQPLARSCK